MTLLEQASLHVLAANRPAVIFLRWTLGAGIPMKYFLIFLGVLLLLPGICGGLFTFAALVEPNSLAFLSISLPSLAVGIGGLFLIRKALRDY